MPRPRITLAVAPPRDDRTVVTVAGVGLTETEAYELVNTITDTIERNNHADTQ